MINTFTTTILSSLPTIALVIMAAGLMSPSSTQPMKERIARLESPAARTY